MDGALILIGARAGEGDRLALARFEAAHHGRPCDLVHQGVTFGPVVVPGHRLSDTDVELVASVEDVRVDHDLVVGSHHCRGRGACEVRAVRSFLAPGDAAGETLFFPTIQVCGDISSDWIAQWDGTGDEPDYPAPSVAVVEGSGDGHGHGGDDDGAAGDSTEGDTDSDGADADGSSDETAADAGSDGSDDESSDSSNALAIAALVVGMGGVVLGGAAFANTRSSKG